jgi:hypothetical protein
MTRYDIIKMAREAGFEIEQPSDGHNVSGDNACLERFVALVAAAEREECAAMVETLLGETPELSEVYVAAEIRARGEQ